MKPALFYQGTVYSLNDIRNIAADLKFVLSRSSSYGLFFLYKQKNTNHLWVGGPFKGPNSNFFLYLGPQKLPKGIGTSFAAIIRQNLENDWKRFKEAQSTDPHDLITYDKAAFRKWANDFFTFSNDAFDGNPNKAS